MEPGVGDLLRRIPSLEHRRVGRARTSSCTFTNRRHARLTVTQDTQPDDPQDFAFSVNGGLTPSSFTLDDDGDDGNGTASSLTFDDVTPGTYSVGQALPSGWSRFFGTCSDGSPISSANIAFGERVTCNVGNTPVGSPAPASGTGAGETGRRDRGSRCRPMGALSLSSPPRLTSVPTTLGADIYVRDVRTGDVRGEPHDGRHRREGKRCHLQCLDVGRWAVCCVRVHLDEPQSRRRGYAVRHLRSRPGCEHHDTRQPGKRGGRRKGKHAHGGAAVYLGRRAIRHLRHRSLQSDPDHTDSLADVYVRDLQANTTTLASRATGAPGAKANNISQEAAISDDGRYVAFVTFSTNLSPDDGDTIRDVYRRDLQTNTTTLVSRASGANGAKGNGDSVEVSMSGDGRLVEFVSTATEPIHDPTSALDIYVRDVQSDVTTLVSRASGAARAKQSNNSEDGAVSGDGRYVSFTSSARKLDPDDGNTFFDVYLRDLLTNETSLISRTTGAKGGPGDAQSIQASGGDTDLSDGARFIGFSSRATNFSGTPWRTATRSTSATGKPRSRRSRARSSPAYLLVPRPQPRSTRPLCPRMRRALVQPRPRGTAVLQLLQPAGAELSPPHLRHPRRQLPAGQGRRLIEDDRLPGERRHARGRGERPVHDLDRRRAEHLRPVGLHRRGGGADPDAGHRPDQLPARGRSGPGHHHGLRLLVRGPVLSHRGRHRRRQLRPRHDRRRRSRRAPSRKALARSGPWARWRSATTAARTPTPTPSPATRPSCARASSSRAS